MTGERAAPIRVRRSRRARRIRIAIDHARGDAELVLPLAASDAEGARFVARHRAWVARQLAALPPRRPFVDGARLPVLGRTIVVSHRLAGPRRTRLDDGRLVVGGRTDEVAARVTAWLRATARDALGDAAARHAAALGATFPALRIGDPKSRWGSCSARGVLSFSWRLVLAPERVLDHVAAHEVAHLREANHGAGFWRLVERLDPDYERSRAWLRNHGPELHRYGE